MAEEVSRRGGCGMKRRLEDRGGPELEALLEAAAEEMGHAGAAQRARAGAVVVQKAKEKLAGPQQDRQAGQGRSR
jgi:hypothetical protein